MIPSSALLIIMNKQTFDVDKANRFTQCICIIRGKILIKITNPVTFELWISTGEKVLLILNCIWEISITWHFLENVTHGSSYSFKQRIYCEKDIDLPN